jgi:mannose-6-phosphate isomerase
MMPHFSFRPIYQPRIWGGRCLESEFGRRLPGSGPIGESWEIVDRPEAKSVVSTGPDAGRTLRELLAGRADEIMGPGWPAERPFPILVKWLDCRERLSLQVHPPASLAKKLGGEPKTENWYFVRTEPTAAVLAGLKPEISPVEFSQALAQGRAEDCVVRHPARVGDSLLIPSGLMHAIDAGCLILEIQQNSDTTYRVFDWGRTGLDGKPRPLHVAESLACLEAARVACPAVQHTDGTKTAVLVDCPLFRLTRRQLAAGETLQFAAGEEPRILSVVEGGLSDAAGATLRYGDNVLLPYAGAFSFTAAGPASVLVTDRFHLPAS